MKLLFILGFRDTMLSHLVCDTKKLGYIFQQVVWLQVIELAKWWQIV